MNAILYDSYTTIHVTPETHCSYASFETNISYGSYQSVISNVLDVFRPKRFVLTMFADENSLRSLKENPFCESSYRVIQIPRLGSYMVDNISSTVVESDMCCYMGNWRLATPDLALKKKRVAHRLREHGRKTRGYSVG